MNNKPRKGQIALAKNDNMTPYQEAVFDLIKAWGHHRFYGLCLMVAQIFTEEEIKDPTYCLTKLFVNSQQYRNDKLSAVSINSTPTPMQTPAVSTPGPVISSPAPVTSPSTIKEESPKSVEDPNLFMDGISELEPEKAPKRNIFNDLVAEWNDKNNIK